MSAVRAPRSLLRRSRLTVGRHAPVRHASTTEKASEAASNAASKAQSTASNFQSKASEGLSKVTSSAGPAITGAARGISRGLGKIGGRTGRLISAIESAIPPTVYYSKVGMELSKLVFQGQKMSPPSLQTFQSYFAPLLQVARNPQSLLKAAPSAGTMTPEAALNTVRNVNRAQLATAGVIFAEVLGFFTVGEMVGRMKIVGYRGEVHHEH